MPVAKKGTTRGRVRSAVRQKVSSPPEHGEEFAITALGIGHGDAILLEYISGHERMWTCLIDGGESPARLSECLATHVRPVKHLDLLVLSHFDNDHIGGLIGITNSVTVNEYWGPAIPAFERHLWAFGEGCRRSIIRAQTLEEELAVQNVDCLYPLEGFSSSPVPNGPVTVSVLFPPAQLLRRLFMSQDITNLLSQEVTPLAQFLNEAPLDADDESNLVESILELNRQMAHCVLSPGSIPSTFRPMTQRQKRSGRSAAPEFFGDSLLNNTSITLYIEFRRASGISSSALLPGDLENWSYLFARHPRGLHADVLKASHHGGRIYVEGADAECDLFNAVKPRALLISANGRHKLPRCSLRSAAISRGAAVFCTSCRTQELISGPPPNSISCHEQNVCRSESENRTIQFNTHGISSSSIACHSGFPSDPGPVIHLQQHIVAPSGVMQQLLERELRRHIQWTKKKLLEIHGQHYVTRTSSSPVPIVSGRILSDAAQREGRPRHSLVENLSTVLEEGAKRQEFWAVRKNRYDPWQAYSLPSDEETKKLSDWIDDRQVLIFKDIASTEFRDSESLTAFLAENCNGLRQFVHQCFGYPNEVFHDLFWPIFSHKLLQDWSCFVLQPNNLLFARHGDHDKLAAEILQQWKIIESRSASQAADDSGKGENGSRLPMAQYIVCTHPFESISLDEYTHRVLFGIYKEKLTGEQVEQASRLIVESSNIATLNERARTAKGDLLRKCRNELHESQIDSDFIDEIATMIFLEAQHGSSFAWICGDLWKAFTKSVLEKIPSIVSTPDGIRWKFFTHTFLNCVISCGLVEIEQSRGAAHRRAYNWKELVTSGDSMNNELLEFARSILASRLKPITFGN